MRIVEFSKPYPWLLALAMIMGAGLLPACAPQAATLPLFVYFDQAAPLIAEKKYTAAIEILEEAAAAHPEEPTPLNRIGQIYLNQRRWLLAEDAFNRALARDLDNALATAGLAEVELNQGRSLEALRLWRQAAQLDPRLPGVFTGLGRTHLTRLEFDAAQTAFLQQQSHQPDPEATWYLAALAAPQDVAQANEYLLQIPAEAPADLLARRDYLLAALVPFTTATPPAELAQATGIALVQGQLWPLAIHALEIARKHAPAAQPAEKAETLAFLGHARAQAGRPALDLFQEARRLDPDSALPPYFYGIYLRRQNALQAAEAQFTQAAELDPANAAIYVELAQTYAEQGNFGATETAYTAALNAASEDEIKIQLLRIGFYALRGYRLEEVGIPAAEALLEKEEENAQLHDLLGWMYFLQGQTEEAESHLQRALELDPTLLSARYHLARYLQQTEAHEAAAAEYRRVIDQDTSGFFRNEALEELQRIQAAQP